jgi:hypothetical protein
MPDNGEFTVLGNLTNIAQYLVLALQELQVSVPLLQFSSAGLQTYAGPYSMGELMETEGRNT